MNPIWAGDLLRALAALPGGTDPGTVAEVLGLTLLPRAPRLPDEEPRREEHVSSGGRGSPSPAAAPSDRRTATRVRQIAPSGEPRSPGPTRIELNTLSTPIAEPAPLFPPPRDRALLAGVASRPTPDGDIDVNTLVDTLARHATVRALPRRPRLTTRGGVCVVVDAGAGMRIFAADIEPLLRRLREVAGRDRVDEWHLTVGPMGEPVRADERAWAPPRGGTVLLVSDLGCSPLMGVSEPEPWSAWIGLLERLGSGGAEVVVLAPGAVGALPTKVRLVTWSERTRVSSQRGQRAVGAAPPSRGEVARFAGALSMAARADPAVVRTVRAVVAPDSGPELESALAASAYVDTATARGLVLHAEHAGRARAALDPVVREAAAAAIRALRPDAPTPVVVAERLLRAAAAGEPVGDALWAAAGELREPALARWARDLYARLPSAARASEGARALAAVAAAVLGVARPIGSGAGRDSTAPARVRLRLAGGLLRLYRPARPGPLLSGWREVEVAGGELEIRVGRELDGVRHTLQLAPGEHRGLDACGEIELRAADGTTWRLEPIEERKQARPIRVYAPGIPLPMEFARAEAPHEADVAVRTVAAGVPTADDVDPVRIRMLADPDYRQVTWEDAGPRPVSESLAMRLDAFVLDMPSAVILIAAPDDPCAAPAMMQAWTRSKGYRTCLVARICPGTRTTDAATAERSLVAQLRAYEPDRVGPWMSLREAVAAARSDYRLAIEAPPPAHAWLRRTVSGTRGRLSVLAIADGIQAPMGWRTTSAAPKGVESAYIAERLSPADESAYNAEWLSAHKRREASRRPTTLSELVELVLGVHRSGEPDAVPPEIQWRLGIGPRAGPASLRRALVAVVLAARAPLPPAVVGEVFGDDHVPAEALDQELAILRGMFGPPGRPDRLSIDAPLRAVIREQVGEDAAYEAEQRLAEWCARALRSELPERGSFPRAYAHTFGLYHFRRATRVDTYPLTRDGPFLVEACRLLGPDALAEDLPRSARRIRGEAELLRVDPSAITSVLSLPGSRLRLRSPVEPVHLDGHRAPILSARRVGVRLEAGPACDVRAYDTDGLHLAWRLGPARRIMGGPKAWKPKAVAWLGDRYPVTVRAGGTVEVWRQKLATWKYPSVRGVAAGTEEVYVALPGRVRALFTDEEVVLPGVTVIAAHPDAGCFAGDGRGWVYECFPSNLRWFRLEGRVVGMATGRTAAVAAWSERGDLVLHTSAPWHVRSSGPVPTVAAWDTRDERLAFADADGVHIANDVHRTSQPLVDIDATALAFLPDGRLLLAVEHRVEVWDLDHRIRVRSLTGHRGPVRGLHVDADGAVLTWSDDRTLIAWDPGLTRAEVLEDAPRLCWLGVDEKGVMAAGPSWERRFGGLLMPRTGEALTAWAVRSPHVAIEGATRVTAVTYLRARPFLGFEDGRIEIRDSRRRLPEGPVRVLVASNSKKALLAATNDDGRVYVMALAGEQLDQLGEIEELGHHRRAVRALAFSTDGALLASGADDGSVMIWHMASRRLWRELPDHGGPINGLAFLESDLLCIVDETGLARACDVYTGEGHGAWRHGAAIASVMSHDGCFYIGTEDGQVLRLAIGEASTTSESRFGGPSERAANRPVTELPTEVRALTQNAHFVRILRVLREVGELSNERLATAARLQPRAGAATDSEQQMTSRRVSELKERYLVSTLVAGRERLVRLTPAGAALLDQLDRGQVPEADSGMERRSTQAYLATPRSWRSDTRGEIVERLRTGGVVMSDIADAGFLAVAVDGPLDYQQGESVAVATRRSLPILVLVVALPPQGAPELASYVQISIPRGPDMTNGIADAILRYLARGVAT